MKPFSVVFILAFILAKAKGSIHSSPALISEDIVDDSRKTPLLLQEKVFPWRLLKTSDHQETFKSQPRKRVGPGAHKRYYGSPTFITDCVQVIAADGTYVVRPGMGSMKACGIYIAGLHNETVRVDFSRVDVTCQDDGVVAFFDGWEMNGHIFPSEDDHRHSLRERVAEMCKETFPRHQIFRVRSTQNVALIQYRIPMDSQGFIFRVSFEANDDPCNILMVEEKRLFTLSNNGEARNCSLTSVFTPNLKLIQFQIGPPSLHSGLISPCIGTDYVDIGGTSTLDPSDMEVKENICGREPEPAKKGLTVLCDSSSVRLVSSGFYENSITVVVKKAEEEDMDYDKNIIMTCPAYL